MVRIAWFGRGKTEKEDHLKLACDTMTDIANKLCTGELPLEKAAAFAMRDQLVEKVTGQPVPKKNRAAMKATKSKSAMKASKSAMKATKSKSAMKASKSATSKAKHNKESGPTTKSETAESTMKRPAAAAGVADDAAKHKFKVYVVINSPLFCFTFFYFLDHYKNVKRRTDYYKNNRPELPRASQSLPSRTDHYKNVQRRARWSHLPAYEGGTNGGGWIKWGNPGFGGGSGRPRSAWKPLKKVGGFAPPPF